MINSTKNTCIVDEELWLDYVENQLEPTMQVDLALHADGCGSCKKNLNQYKALRSVLSQKEVIPADDFFTRLEGKIMAQVSKNEIASPPLIKRGNIRIALSTMMAAVFVLFLTLVLNQTGVQPQKQLPLAVAHVGAEDELFVQTSSHDLVLLNDVINAHQGFEEAIFDAAAHKMMDMDEGQARRVLGL